MKESLRPWESLTKDTLDDVRADIWKAQAINRAAYRLLEDEAAAGSVPSLEGQTDIVLLLKVSLECMEKAEAILNSYI